MATFNKYKSNLAVPVDGLKRKGVSVVRINTQLSSIVSGDDWRVFYIPARTIISCVDIVGVSPQGTASGFSVGDNASATQFFNNASANLAAGASVTANNFAIRKYYHNADFIRVTANSTLNNAVFDLFIHWEYLGELPTEVVF